MKLVQHEKYETMYYIEWPDKSRSDDFYNKSRANWYRREIQSSIASRRALQGPEKPAGAFK